MLDLLLPKRKAATDYWPPSTTSGRVHTRAGVGVDEDIAFTYSAIWCAYRIISETVSGLPLHLYRRLPDGSREIAKDHPKNRVVQFPNPKMGGRSLRESMVVHQLNYGSGFAEIEYNGDMPVYLWPIHASRVRPARPQDRLSSGEAIPEENYIVRNNDGTSMTLTPREMLHVPGAFAEDGTWGKSITQHARETIGFGLAHLRHGATSFGAGNVPRVVAHLPGLKDKAARQQFRSEWKQIHGSPDSGEIAIVPPEGKITPLSITNVDAEFIASGVFGVKDVARYCRLPMHMLGEYEKAASYASVEMQGIEFVIYSLLPWVLRWEEQLNLKLLTEEERDEYYYEHNVSGLLRGDHKTRMEGYEVGIRTGIYSINMVCAMENLPGIGDAGDVRYVPMNMTTAERMAIAPPDETVPEEIIEEPDVSGEPADELLDVPDFRQGTDYSCGCAAVQSVAEYFGVGEGREEAEYIAELGATSEAGTQPEAMIDWLTDHGLTVTAGQKWTLDNLRAFFEKGQPVIVPVQMYGMTPEYDAEEAANRTGHYVVVIGVGLGMVFFQDPSAGRQMLTAEEFDRIWHDVEADGVVDDHFGIAVGDAVAVETQEEKDAENAESKNTQGSDRNGNSASSNGAVTSSVVSDTIRTRDGLSAARQVLSETLQRMFRKESNSAMRGAKGDFFKWIETWENKHRETLIDALGPACASLRAAGVSAEPTELARRLVADSVTALRLAYDTDTREQFAERMATWADVNAKRVSDGLLAQEVKPAKPCIIKTIERDSEGNISRVIEEKS